MIRQSYTGSRGIFVLAESTDLVGNYTVDVFVISDTYSSIQTTFQFDVAILPDETY